MSQVRDSKVADERSRTSLSMPRLRLTIRCPHDKGSRTSVLVVVAELRIQPKTPSDLLLTSGKNDVTAVRSTRNGYALNGLRTLIQANV
jgi:hypothetical protein